MKNSEQFEAFLRCCKEQRVKRIHLAEPCLLANPWAGDFGSILIEFERCNYFVTSKCLPHKPDDAAIDEFSVKRYDRMVELKEGDWTEADIYKTISAQEHSVAFLRERVDSDGFFNCMAWKLDGGVLLFIVDSPTIIVRAACDEELSFPSSPSDDAGCSELFPET